MLSHIVGCEWGKLGDSMAATAGQDDLRGERDRFVAFSFAAADLLVEVGRDGKIRFASGAAQCFSGRSAEQLTGQPFEDLLAEQDRRFVDVLLQELAVGARLEPVVVQLATPGSRPSTAVLGGCRLPSHPDSLFLTFGTPRHAPMADGRPAPRDAASGLLDRSAFEGQAAELTRQHMLPAAGAKLSLLQLVGMDAFRARAGADGAKEFLREAGAYLRAVSVNGDGAGRIAEDKLGVIHHNAIDPTRVSDRVAELARVADPSGQGMAIDGGTIDLALDTMTEGDAARAIAYSIACFAESSGNFAIASLQEAFRTLLRDTVARIGALKGTVLESRFDIAFQPIVDLSTRAIQHHELLARLEDGKSPYALVTFAEGVGMIEEFDLAVCQRAIEFLNSRGSGNTAIAVNLSGRSLESALFAEALFALLQPHAKLAPRLLFELTESTQINALDHVNAVIQSLRAKGHRFALDDFGAGASSYPYLHALTVDFVKIDGAYVRRVLESSRDAAILRSMVSLCRELGVKTIAEMIETEEQAKALHALGVDHGQGYLFGKPAKRPIVREQGAMRNVAPVVRHDTTWS